MSIRDKGNGHNESTAATKRKLAVFTIVVEVPEGESYEWADIRGVELRNGYLTDFEATSVTEAEFDA